MYVKKIYQSSIKKDAHKRKLFLPDSVLMIITFNKLAAERRAYFSGSNISQGSVAIHI